MVATRLLIETSGRGGHVGLATPTQLLVRPLDTGRRHNRDLASAVQSLLTEVGLLPREVTEVAVSVGPGSYTGLRVGVVSAKAWAYATGANLLAVPTFAIHAEQSPRAWDTVDVISNGLQGLIYLQDFQQRDTLWVALSPLRILAATDWVAARPVMRPVAGPAVALVEPLLPADTPRAPEADRVPTLAAMDRVAIRLTPLGREELFALEPTYLRGSSAEEQAARKRALG